MFGKVSAVKCVLAAVLKEKGCCAEGAYLDVAAYDIFDSLKAEDWKGIEALIAAAEKIYGKPAEPAVESVSPVISAAA